MKYVKILAILVFSSVIFFYGCKDDTKASKQESSQPVKVVDPTTPPNAKNPNPTTLEPAQNAIGVWHYTCNKGCAGGAGSAVNCKNCGGVLAHNTAYHSTTNSTTKSTPTSSSPFANQTPAEPSRNAAGVWHYTCANGCAGGAGAAGNCGTCGGALAHNSAYH